MNRKILTLTAAFASISLAGLASAQTMRASCDNRQGTTFADVVDSSDATQGGYNIDPSEIYRSFNAIGFPAVQNAGPNLTSADLVLTSSFLGANPGNRTTGFISEATGNASVTRVNTNVQARSQNIINVCMDLTGASTTTPSFWRLVANVTTSGGATGLTRLQGPGGSLIHSMTGGSNNRIVRLTTNGQYQLRGEFDTGMLSLTSGGNALSRGASVKASLVCVADYNASGTITVQDIFDFLTAWFAGDLSADSNATGTVTVQDVFDFLGVWFTGCV